MLFSDESISEWRYPTKSLDNGVPRQLASRQDRNRVTMHFPITAVKQASRRMSLADSQIRAPASRRSRFGQRYQ
jgi:hypothetical protein